MHYSGLCDFISNKKYYLIMHTYIMKCYLKVLTANPLCHHYHPNLYKSKNNICPQKMGGDSLYWSLCPNFVSSLISPPMTSKRSRKLRRLIISYTGGPLHPMLLEIDSTNGASPRKSHIHGVRVILEIPYFAWSCLVK